jgi:hypothetical protein
MKILYAVILFVLITFGSNAQAPSWLWARGSVGTGGSEDDRALSTATDPQGNLYVTGFFNSDSITFGSITLTNPGMFLVKYDAAGNVIWAKEASGSNDNFANSVATDALGNIYIAGQFYSTIITFGSITLTDPGMFVVKYDPSGNIIWAKDANGNNSSVVCSIALDDLGNIFVGGKFGANSLIIGSDTLLFGYYDRFVAKYDTAGNPIWARGLYTGGYIENVDAPFISADKFGNVYATGGFHVGTCVIVTTQLVNQGDDNIYLAKFNGSGNLLWAKRFGDSGHNDGTSVAVDTSGNIYIAGYFTDVNIIFSPVTIVGGGGLHAYLVKLDPNGNAIWGNKIKWLWGYKPVKIATDKNQCVYITGYFGSTAGSPALLFTPTDSLVNEGLFLAKYDSDGNFKWARDAIRTGNKINRATSVSVDGFGVSFIAGYFATDTLIFDANTIYNTNFSFSVFVAAMNTTTLVKDNMNFHEKDFSVFPNPSLGRFYVLTNPNEQSSIIIYDMMGKEVLNRKINNEMERIDLSTQPKGVYFVTASTESGRYSTKIIIQ